MPYLDTSDTLALMLITPEQAAARIEGAGLDLVGAWETVVKRHRQVAAEFPDFVEALTADPSARASSYHAQVKAVVQDQAEALEGVTPSTKLQMFTLSLPPDLLMRFKFVGSGGPSNHSSRQQDLLARQKYTQPMLDDLEVFSRPPTLVTCGYDIDGDQLAAVTIQCDCVGRESWKLSLYPNYEVLEEPIIMGGFADPLPAKVLVKDAIAVRETPTDTLAG